MFAPGRRARGRDPEVTLAEGSVRRVVVAGNPNAGKSTLFNALTGGSARVGNFAGTTVSSLSGRKVVDGIGEVEFVDVPGTYSLAAASPDERVALDALLGAGVRRPDVVLMVADAPRLLRSLYLVLQVLELGLPVVLAVNLLDEAEQEGIEIQLDALQRALGVPVIGTVARSRRGVVELEQALAAALRDPRPSRPVHGWSAELEADLVALAQELPAEVARLGPTDAMARWVLLSADADGRVPGVPTPVAAVTRLRARAKSEGRDIDAELVGARYRWLDAREGAFVRARERSARTVSDTIDRVLLNPVLGPIAFLAVAGFAFTALFAWADPFVTLIEQLFAAVGDGVAGGFDAAITAVPSAGPALEIVRDLFVDGVIGGVGSVLVFLPQIGLLFLFLALLEDCGYLARAAHLADRILRLAGLPGRAFVPVLSGYACAVPAILATRTLPRRRDRLLTMMVIPLTSCSARLPVYTLLIAALFPPVVNGWVPMRPLMLGAMYLFSTLLAVGASVVLGNTVLPDRQASALIELPPFRWPDPWVVAKVVWARCTDFVREAGGLILGATIVMWALLYFPRYTPADVLSPEVIATHTAAEAEALAKPLALERSIGGRIGHAIEPVIAPLGYDWRIGVGLLGAFAAREVFVSTMGVVYGIGDDVDEESQLLRERLQTEVRADGTRLWTPAVGLSLMVFFAVALQCTSTIAVLRKESASWTVPAFVFGWTFALAWGLAFVVYHLVQLVQ